MTTYQLTGGEAILRSDGALIPADYGNVDYQNYLAWVAEGNAAEPANQSTLADIQAAQIALLDGEYSKAVQNSVSFTTAAGIAKTYQADNVGPLSSQSVLLKAFTGFNIVGATPDGFAWTSQDNVDVPFTLADLAGLYGVMLQQGNEAFTIRKSLKAQVREIKVKSGVTLAQAIAAVQAITWP